MLSQNTETDAQALLASAAILAPAAGQTWIKNHLGANLDAVDAAADRVHDPSPVRPADMGQFDRNAGYPLQDEKVEMVEGGCFQSHPHLARARFWLRTLTEKQLVDSPVLFEVQSFHRHLRGADIVTAFVPLWHDAKAWALRLGAWPTNYRLLYARAFDPRSQATSLKPAAKQQNPAEAGFCGSTGGWGSGTLIIENETPFANDSSRTTVVLRPNNDAVLTVRK